MCDLYGSVGVQTHRLKSSTKDRPKTTIEQQQQRRVHWLNIRAMVIRDGAPMHTSDCRWSYTLLSSNACFNHSPAQPSTTINSVVAERSPAAVLTHLPRRRSSRIASYSQVYTEVPSACKSACKLPPSSKKTINKKQKTKSVHAHKGCDGRQHRYPCGDRDHDDRLPVRHPGVNLDVPTGGWVPVV